MLKKFLLAGACLAALTGVAHAKDGCSPQSQALQAQQNAAIDRSDAMLATCTPGWVAEREHAIALYHQFQAAVKNSPSCGDTNPNVEASIRANIKKGLARCAAKSADTGVIDCSKPPRASGKTPWWYKCHREDKSTKGMSVEQQRQELKERLEAKERETNLLNQAERQGPPSSMTPTPPKDESTITLPGGTPDEPTTRAARPTETPDAAPKKEPTLTRKDLNAPFPRLKPGEKLCSNAIPPSDPFYDPCHRCEDIPLGKRWDAVCSKDSDLVNARINRSPYFKAYLKKIPYTPGQGG